MEFDENHKVKWWLLEKEEVKVDYIPFLLEEMTRHLYARSKSAKKARFAESRFRKLLWGSEGKRQQESIDEIRMLIQEVKHWHQI